MTNTAPSTPLTLFAAAYCIESALADALEDTESLRLKWIACADENDNIQTGLYALYQKDKGRAEGLRLALRIVTGDQS